MFRKKPKPDENRLGDRLKAIAGDSTFETPEKTVEYVDTRVRANDRSIREAVYKQATIQLRDGARMSVVVKNMSKTGARIEYFQNTALSDVVYLIEPTSDIRTWCDVVWEKSGVAGLRYLDPE